METHQATGVEFEEGLFRLILENLRDYSVFAIDTEGAVLSWSPGAEKVLGYREGEILGRSSFVTFTPEDAAAGVPRKELETALAKGRAEDTRWHVRKDGSRFFASGVARGHRYRNRHGSERQEPPLRAFLHDQSSIPFAKPWGRGFEGFLPDQSG